MKKTLLLLAAILVSFNAMAAKLVPTKIEFPNYAGYIVVTGSADYLYNQLAEDLNDDDEFNGSIIADRDSHTIKLTIREKEIDIDVKFTMTFTTAKDRIYYRLKVNISSDGDDITELIATMGIGGEMDEVVEDMLKEIANEL